MMLRVLVGLVLVGAAVGALAPLSRTPKEEDRVKGEYIVVLRAGNGTALASERAEHMKMVEKMGGSVLFEYKHTIQGYSAKLSEAALLSVRQSGLVRYVEENQMARINQECTTQNDVSGAWGLDRVSHCTPNGGSRTGDFQYPTTAGEGIELYVIDTGVYCPHEEFGSRCRNSPNFVTGEQNIDCNGHGTHVASTAAGIKYGMAKQSAIYGVKVLGCFGSGSYAGVIAGVDWVAANHDESQGAGVANLSLGGGASSALDEALAACIEDGVLPVVAAGNSNNNACTGSPARGDAVITVGATSEPPPSGTDTRASFSSYGECVDVMAPGVSIQAGYSTCDGNGNGCSSTATSTLSGTSMASPHAAGLALLLAGQKGYAGNPTAIKEMECDIDLHAWGEIVDMNCNGNAICEATCNALLSTSYSGCGDQPGGECQWPSPTDKCRCVEKKNRKSKARAAAGEGMVSM